MKQKKTIKQKPTYPIYEIINFYHDFKNNGYVRKFLYFFQDQGTVPGTRSEYYNNREMTEVPCVDGDIIVVSHYELTVNTYTLIKMDFSKKKKYQVLKTLVRKKHEQVGFESYILANNLIEVKSRPEEKKQPHIDFGYGQMTLEIIEYLTTASSEHLPVNKKLAELLIKKNTFRSDSLEKSIVTMGEPSREGELIRFKHRTSFILDTLFDDDEEVAYSFAELLATGKQYQQNYKENI